MIAIAVTEVGKRIARKSKEFSAARTNDVHANIRNYVQIKLDQFVEKGILYCSTTPCDPLDSDTKFKSHWPSDPDRDWDHDAPTSGANAHVFTYINFYVCVQKAIEPANTLMPATRSLANCPNQVVVKANFLRFQKETNNAVFALFSAKHFALGKNETYMLRTLVAAPGGALLGSKGYREPNFCFFMQPMGESYDTSNPYDPGSGLNPATVSALLAITTPPPNRSTDVDGRYQYVFPKLLQGTGPNEFIQSVDVGVSGSVYDPGGSYDLTTNKYPAYSVMQSAMNYYYQNGYRSGKQMLSIDSVQDALAIPGKADMGIEPTPTGSNPNETPSIQYYLSKNNSNTNNNNYNTNITNWEFYHEGGFNGAVKKMYNACKVLFEGTGLFPSGQEPDFCTKMNVPHQRVYVKSAASCTAVIDSKKPPGTPLPNDFSGIANAILSAFDPSWMAVTLNRSDIDLCDTSSGGWLEKQHNKISNANQKVGQDYTGNNPDEPYHDDPINPEEIKLSDYFKLMNGETVTGFANDNNNKEPLTSGTQTYSPSCINTGSFLGVPFCRQSEYYVPSYKQNTGSVNLNSFVTSKCVYTGYAKVFDPEFCTTKTILLKVGGPNNGAFQCRNIDGCFMHNTLVTLADGSSKMFRDLKETDLLWNPKLKKPAKIKRLTIGPEKKPLYRVRVGASFVDVTEVHPFRTPKGWFRIKDLKEGDLVLHSNDQFEPISKLELLFAYDEHMVANVEIDAESNLLDEHYLLADGIVTGDLFIQEILEQKGTSWEF
jgi:hypothetical protein